MIDLIGFDSIFSLIPAAFLSVVYAVQVWNKPLLRQWIRPLSIGVPILTFMLLLVLASARFEVWRLGESTNEFVSPFVGAGYFISYAGFRLFAQYIVSLLGAFMVCSGLMLANKKTGGRIFEREEPYVAGIAMFLAGWPGMFVYGACIFLFGFFGSAYAKIVKKEYFSLYSIWLPAAILVILLREWIFNGTGLWVLEFSRTF